MPVRAAKSSSSSSSSSDSQHTTPAPAPHRPMIMKGAPPHPDSRDDNLSLAPTTARVVVNGSVAAVDNNHDDGPPPKRRRLSIRTASHSKHTLNRQTTLDAYAFAKSSAPQPPSKVTVQQPHGPLLRTLNGVRTTLDAHGDGLSRPSPKPERIPQRTSRSPHPAPPTQPKQEDKRTLRSQDDGPRLKSELATYFPNYEDVIFDVEQEEEFLTVDTALYITDDTKPGKPESVSPAKASKNAANGRRTSVIGTAPSPFSPPRSSSSKFNGSPILNLDFMAKTLPDKPADPLTDEYFLKSHRRAERKEKQLRNIEKERAMHEKVQLDRLLDGLQGHDWLRVLGITGVTDTEAKKFEAKRDYFIAEVQALVDKFRQWREQEKKQRLVKEAAAAAREAEEEGDTTEGSVDPPSSDLNASAARQLQQETVNALKSLARPSGKGKGPAHPTSHPSTPTTIPAKLMLPPQPPSPEMPITSFYSKPHLRDAALGKARHGRNVYAFGQPIPDLEEQEFELPDDYVTEDALRANARERRRRKRESAANAPSKKAS